MTKKAEIYYARLDEFWTKEEKYEFLEKSENLYNIEWQSINPNSKNHWLTDDLEEDFDTFISLGDKKTKLGSFEEAKTIFYNYSCGVSTARDAWVYNFNSKQLITNISKMIETYNYDLVRYQNNKNNINNIDDFVSSDYTKISWAESLKLAIKRNIKLVINDNFIRNSYYRPFIKSFLYFDKYLNERRYQFSVIFPTQETEKENLVICVSGLGSSKYFHSLIVSCIPCLDIIEKTQCFPYYIYDKDGSNKRENITDYSLQQFREFYQDSTITKWEIFYYVYAILHHPEYRTKYAANLKRELPRIPTIKPFKEICKIGEKLADIHVNYESQKGYPLKMIENPDIPVNLRVEKIKLSKDKTQLIYNDYLTLTGIPKEVFDYKLGNKSALDWIIDQYQIKTDKRSCIINDPNNLDDEMYIIRLIKKIITVSLETVKLVSELNEYLL